MLGQENDRMPGNLSFDPLMRSLSHSCHTVRRGDVSEDRAPDWKEDGELRGSRGSRSCPSGKGERSLQAGSNANERNRLEKG